GVRRVQQNGSNRGRNPRGSSERVSSRCSWKRRTRYRAIFPWRNLAGAETSEPYFTSPMKLTRLLVLVLALLGARAAFAEQFSVLLFSKTAGWHHESINSAVTAVRNLGQLHDFGVFWTEDPNRVFNDK